MFVVVTVVAVWLGWEMRFVSHRKAWLREHPAALQGWVGYPDAVTIPAWRRWAGDAAIPALVWQDEWTKDDLETMHYLFPEAHVVKIKTNAQGMGQLTSPNP